jgi:GT2 family glycosyltransferase
VRNAGVLRGAVEGNWTYQDAGILDRTHLRFFTRREIDGLFERAGFPVQATASVDEQSLQQWEALGRPTSISFGPLVLSGLPAEEIREFFVIQWLVRGQAQRQTSVTGKTSIIILTHNQLEYTRQCVESVLQHTAQPYDLILVDNASTDGTVDFLRSIPGAKVVAISENIGFAGGNNQGLAVADGEYVLLLNNDTVVTPGWLDRMIAALERDPRVGVVGPRSNNVAGAQLVANVPYTDRAGLDAFAAQHAETHAGKGSNSGWVIGFCLLARRNVVEQIGGLDTRYGPGNFEDNDFCMRSMLAGWSCWIADDAFVHHYGGRTFAGAGIDYGASVRTNARIFADKWGIRMNGDELAQINLRELLNRPFDRAQDFCPLPPNVVVTQPA